MLYLWDLLFFTHSLSEIAQNFVLSPHHILEKMFFLESVNFDASQHFIESSVLTTWNGGIITWI